MLYIGDGDFEETESEEYLPLARAVEDGVMNIFFDSGHIIFNNGFSADAQYQDPPFDAERLPVRLAKGGGARYLLEVRLDYAGAGTKSPEITSAEYRFSNVVAGNVLRTGRISGTDSGSTDFDEPEQRWRNIGREIAEGSLSIW